MQFHLADLFEDVAARIGDRIALRDDRGEITYAQMEARASRLAAGLWAQGLRRGDHVGLYLMNGPEYLESFFALLKIGAVPFNVNYRYGFEELRYLFSNADAKAVVFGVEFSEMVARLMAELPELDLCVSVGQSERLGGTLSYEDLMKSEPRKTPFERHEDDYFLQYTGGTTGLPKGVMWPHKAFFFACLGGGGMYARKPPIEQPEQQADIAEQSYPLRILPVAPLMHGAAIWTALSGLLGGQTLVLDPMRGGFEAAQIWDRVEREEVNILQIVGDAMAVPLLEALQAEPERWNLTRLVHLGSGGAVFSQPVKDALKALLPSAIMGDGMGTSETGISGMGEPAGDAGFMRLPINAFQNVIADGKLVELGEIGNLARTGYTPIGYYGDPEKTAEIFCEIEGQIWVLTGDKARRDEGDMMSVLGRGSTCINSGGEKIYPEEVEGVLRAHPAVHDAVVLGLPDPKWGQSVAAVISVCSGEDAPTLETLKVFCQDHLANYKLPKTLKIVPAIRRSPAGKQDYKWAQSLFAQSDKT